MANDSVGEALQAFASSVSGGDPELTTRVAQIVASPPTTLEEIGFYGAEDASPEERAFRATIFALDNSDYMMSFEDKYINEMPSVLGERGWLDPDLSDQANQHFISIGEKYETHTREEIDTFARSIFTDHVALLERAEAATKMRLLYIDLPLGDTFHLVRVSPEVADKWRNTVFLKTETDSFAVTAPQWDIYWAHLTSALDLDWKQDAPVPEFDASVLMSLADKGF